MSAIRRCPLYRVLDFFKEKIIIGKCLTIFYVNDDSLQLHVLKCIWIVLCLTFCNLSVSTFPINLFSMTFICLSPSTSPKHFTASRLSRASDAVTFLTFCSSSAIIYNSFHSSKVVGHVPLSWTELTNRFLKFSNHNIRVVVTGKKVNRRIGLGLEIPADYSFHEDNRVITWF